MRTRELPVAGWATPTAADRTDSQYCYGRNHSKQLKLPGQVRLLVISKEMATRLDSPPSMYEEEDM